MKKIITAVVACSIMFGGCVNIAFTRNPFSDSKIGGCYQSTRIAACAAVVVAFPQMMSDNPSDYDFMFGNIFTVPLSVVVFADAICESPIDTLCLPYDMFASEKK